MEVFWRHLADIDSQYTPQFFIEHNIPIEKLVRLNDLGTDFYFGKICYREFERAVIDAAYLDSIPKIKAQFSNVLETSYLPDDMDDVVTQLSQNVLSPTPVTPSRQNMDLADPETRFSGMHQAAMDSDQRNLLKIIMRTFIRLRVEHQITAETLQSCLILAKNVGIPLTQLAQRALQIAVDTTDPNEPPHPHFKQLVLWIKENLTPEQLVLIGFENNITPFFPNGLTNHDEQ